MNSFDLSRCMCGADVLEKIGMIINPNLSSFTKEESEAMTLVFSELRRSESPLSKTIVRLAGEKPFAFKDFRRVSIMVLYGYYFSCIEDKVKEYNQMLLSLLEKSNKTLKETDKTVVPDCQ